MNLRIVLLKLTTTSTPALLSLIMLLALPLLSVRAQDADNDGMEDTYEALYGLDWTDPNDAGYDYDADTLLNIAEYLLYTDPFQADSDGDGFADNADAQPLSRVNLNLGMLDFVDGDVFYYPGPLWWLDAVKAGGTWQTEGWTVLQGDTSGQLALNLDRNSLTNNLWLKTEVQGGAGAELYIDILDEQGGIILQAVNGNLIYQEDDICEIALELPLEENEQGSIIQLRRQAGSITVAGCMLYIDQDGDGLDDDQEAQIGTDPLSGDDPRQIPGCIQAEDFDEGGEGLAYHDTTSGNSGGQYRSGDVDIESVSDIGGGYNIGWANAGEWLRYTIYAREDGVYTLTVRVANNEASGSLFHLEIDGVDVSGALVMPATGGWQNWQDVTVEGVALAQGLHELKLVLDTQVGTSYLGNYNYIDFAIPQTVSRLAEPESTDVPKGILREWWLNIGSGNAIADLTTSANYPDLPDGAEIVTNVFEGPVSWTDQYGTRMRGYFIPRVSGPHTFWIATDDNGELWLSTDDDPANASRIASISSWAGSRDWNKYSSQQSAAISLVAGQRYYIEALQKEGGGGDNIAVAVQSPNGVFEGPMPCTYLEPWVVDTNTTPEPVGNGVLGAYFDGMDLSDLKYTQVNSRISFDWGSGSPHVDLLGNDYFSIRWTGEVEADYSETYTFTTRSDDGVRLWVNDMLIIDSWIDQSPTEHSGTITLSAGQRYALKMEFYENGGGAVAQLSWQSASLPKEIVPSDHLFTTAVEPPVNTAPVVDAGADQALTLPAAAILNGTVADDGLPAGTLTVTWNQLSGPGVVTFGDEHLAHTTADFSTDGVYVLRVTADDGARLSHDDITVTISPAVVSDIGILREWWENIGSGNAIADLTGSANYPDVPTGSEVVTTYFEGPVNGADQYGTRMRAYFLAPQSGDYTFWIATDDNGELWLSSDDDPTNAVLIAQVTSWTSSREWNKYASQQSAAITLVAGQYYYIEALQKEGGGGDNIAVAVELPDGTFEGPAPASRFVPWGTRFEGTGLRGEYFDGMAFDTAKFAREDATVDFEWGSGSPDTAQVGNDYFSIRWTGEIRPEFTETYTFTTRTDDGIRLWINDVPVIDYWIPQSPTERSGSIDLVAGQRYSIKMEYYEQAGGAVAQLSWQSPSQPKEIIPATRLYPASSGTDTDGDGIPDTDDPRPAIPNEAPVVQLGPSQSTANYHDEGGISLTVHATDADGDTGIKYEFSINGGAWEAAASAELSLIAAELSAGELTIAARARDEWGAIGSSQSVTMHIFRTPPRP